MKIRYTQNTLPFWKRRATVFFLFVAAVCVAGAIFWVWSSMEGEELAQADVPVHTADSSDAPAELLASADNAPPPASEEKPAEPGMFTSVVQPGQTAGLILQQWLSAGEIQSVADASQDLFALRRLRHGKEYTVTLDGGKFSTFEYEIDTDRKLIVSKGDEGFSARLEDIRYDIIIERIETDIESNLFQAVADSGEAPSLAIALAEIFAWEINFIRDVQVGDSFTVIVEKRFKDGEFKGYGAIIAASFVNQKTPFEAFLFTDSVGEAHYFTSKGESVKRAFLKAPLSFTRISSTFTNSRLHPVLNVWRAHPGIDYAAPTGTPVKAVSRGTVTFAGWGKGAGNYIALRHGNNYETMYLHLSGFASGVKKGASVTQGQTIGYVGSTGYSTGPHLDFRMKHQGVYVNPLKSLSPRSEPVRAADMPTFTAHASIWRNYLTGAIPLPIFMPLSIPSLGQ